MPSLREIQRAMRDHAFDHRGPEAAAAAIADVHAFSPAERLTIHRNATLLGLGAAMTALFPTVGRLVGAAFFDRMARDYLRARPPRDPRLARLGGDFPAFVGAYAPAAGLPYLADVARLEVARTHAFHAAEAEPLRPEALLAIPEDRLGELRLTPHPSLRFVASAWPVAAIWEANRPDVAEPPPIDLGRGGETVLVWRPDAEVRVRAVGSGVFAFLMALATDQPLATAWDGARAVDPAFQLVPELQALFLARCFHEARLP